MSNGMNQYTSVGNQAIGYDDHFNVASYNGASFIYDAANRLVGGSMQATYDGLGRCVRRVTSSGTRLYTYDGWKPILEWNGKGAWQAWNIYGAGPDEILARNDATYGATLYKQDKQGNVVALLNANGNVLEKYFYDAFGYPTVTDYSGNERGHASSCGNRFLFTGREWIAELGIYDYRNRMYHPGLGRFLQTDPTGFDAGDMNLYRYCADDPVDLSDPLGLVPPGKELMDVPKDTLRAIWQEIQDNVKNVNNRANWDNGGKERQEYGALGTRSNGKLEQPLIVKGTRDGQERRPVTDFSRYLTPERRQKLDHVTHVHFNLPAKHFYRDAPTARQLHVISGVGSTLNNGKSAEIFVPANKGNGPGGFFRTRDGEHLTDLHDHAVPH